MTWTVLLHDDFADELTALDENYKMNCWLMPSC